MFRYCLQTQNIGFLNLTLFSIYILFSFQFEFAIIFPFLFFFRFAKSIENLSEGTHGYLNAWDVQNTQMAKRGVRVCMRAPTGIPLPPTPTVQTAPLSHLTGQVWVPAAQPQVWPWALPSHTTTDSHTHRHQLWPSLAQYTQFHKVLGPCCPAVWEWSMQQHPRNADHVTDGWGRHQWWLIAYHEHVDRLDLFWSDCFLKHYGGNHGPSLSSATAACVGNSDTWIVGSDGNWASHYPAVLVFSKLGIWAMDGLNRVGLLTLILTLTNTWCGFCSRCRCWGVVVRHVSGCSWSSSPAQSEPAYLVWWGFM